MSMAATSCLMEGRCGGEVGCEKGVFYGRYLGGKGGEFISSHFFTYQWDFG